RVSSRGNVGREATTRVTPFTESSRAASRTEATGAVAKSTPAKPWQCWSTSPPVGSRPGAPGRPVASGGAGLPGSEEPGVRIIHTAHRVVVQDEAADATVLGQGAGLGLDLLGGEHASHGG